MSRRIEIELTSARPDGTWTWRAAGARVPKGVLAGSILSGEPKVGDVLRAEVETELEGTTVLNVAPIKSKAEKSGLLEILPSAKPFEAVTQQLAGRGGGRGDRGDRGDRRDRPPRRTDGDRPGRPDGDRRPPRTDGPGGAGDRRPRREGDRPVRAGADVAGGERRDRRPRPSFTPPPELPQRPKPKRLKPGRKHRSAVLADLPESQRAVAERALQGGIPAVRQAVQEQNTRLKAEGKEEIPAAGLIQMAEQLLPRLRVAEWLDRAEAAKADIAELSLPDLRSVVASSEDPVVARDETTRALAAELKAALMAKQESETLLWLDDITAALGVGRVIRALKLSSQPPKAGVPFPAELATRLAEGATASLTADALPDRWSALLEAAAFSPVRAQIKPTAAPTQMSDELTATIKRVAPALPHIAALFGIEVTSGSSMPKPMRPGRPTASGRKPLPPQPPSSRAKPPKPEATAKDTDAKPEASATPAAADTVETAPAPAQGETAATAVPVAETAPAPAETEAEGTPVETAAEATVEVEASPVDAEPAALAEAETAVEAAPAAAEAEPAVEVEPAAAEAEPAAAEPEPVEAADAEAESADATAPASTD